MAKIKKKDFIEVEYTGRLKETEEVFDTTDKKLSVETGIHQENMAYGPIIICVGESQLLKGLEDELIGKEPGEYKIELTPEKAFGKKDIKLIKMIPASTFRAQEINPEPGLQINVDGLIGLIKTAAGGRCLVDFNHPVSGKDIVYDIKINRIIKDDAEKIKGFLELSLNIRGMEVKVEDGIAKITTKQDLPKQIHESIAKKVKDVLPSIKDVQFVMFKEKKPEEKKTETSK